MQNGAPAENSSASTSSQSFGLWATLTFLLFASTLFADRFRGQARHEFLENIPVSGARLEMVDANDPTQSDIVVTDALGYFQSTAFDAGDEVRITAIHPAYQRETPTVTLATADHFESILMSPLGGADVTTDYHDVIIQVVGAVTQLALNNVPVKVTQWDAAGTLQGTTNVTTDAKGVAVLLGMRSGFYEFTINDSALPNDQRRPRYEDHSTPANARVEIIKDHFTNVFLKPLKQDLKVRVRGYDFKEKDADAALENVLVEIRGLDPADLTREVLHARSDFTVLFEEGTGGLPPAGSSVDDSIFYLDNGEVVFQGLPPAAYEVKVSRYGYITQRIILEPDPTTGILPNSYDNPLEVILPAEGHGGQIVLEFEDYVPPTFDQSGKITGSGIYGLGLKVRLIGLEGTNTEGLEYEATTVQNFNGETYAAVGPLLSGRYRVFVDGISDETNFRFDEFSGFFFPRGPDYDVAVSGQSIIEVPVGRDSVSPEFHRFPVQVETPLVSIRGQLVAAERIEPDSRDPIFRSVADQEIEIVANPIEVNQALPFSVTVTTDADGFFRARVLPGAYGIRLPGMDDFFGDAVVVRVGNAARENDADQTHNYEWPLAEAFPDIPGSTNLQAHKYFELLGIPIHAARDQFLELRVRRETYTLETFGSESTELNRRVIAIPAEGSDIEVDYSPTVGNQTIASLQGDSGSFDTAITYLPPGKSPPGFGNIGTPLYAIWEGLPPGSYTSITGTVPNHDFSGAFAEPKILLDWPTPGSAPPPEQAALFDVNNFPNNQFPKEPLDLVAGSFLVTMTPYEESTYKTFFWEARLDENGEPTGDYILLFEGAGGFMSESSDGRFFGGSAALGGPIAAVWVNGQDKDGNGHTVKLLPGVDLFLGGDSFTKEEPLPSIKYSLQLDGVAETDQATKIDGANYTVGPDSLPIKTGQRLPGFDVEPFVDKVSGDNFIHKYQTRFRLIEDSATPVIGITVGLKKGMEVSATVRDMTIIGSSPIDIPAAELSIDIRNRYGRLISTKPTDAEGKVSFQALPFADYFLTLDEPGYTPMRRRLLASAALPGDNDSTEAKHVVSQDVILLPRPVLQDPGVPHNRWGMFLPGVSRAGNVKLEESINNFDFFSAKEALTTTWTVEVTPHELNITLPGFDISSDVPATDETLTGPDAIVAAYLIDERRFNQDGFVGGAIKAGDENDDELFVIPAGDEPKDLAELLKTINSATQVQGEQVGAFVSTSLQRRVFVDPAETIKINAETGRTVVTGSFPLWDIPAGAFEPVIVLKTQRGAFQVHKVSYTGENVDKQLTGPELPPWFANLLDLFGIASGVASTQNRVKEALKDYVPEDKFVPLPDFSMNITVDKDAGKEAGNEGYLKYAVSLGMGEQIGQDSKADGLLAYGPGFLGAKISAKGELTTSGRDNITSFTLSADVTKDNLIDEKFGTKIAPVGGSIVKFENPKFGVSTTASSNYPGKLLTKGRDPDPLKFELKASSFAGAKAKVTTNLNQYFKPIPYAGAAIGILGTTGLGSLDASIEGRIATRHTYTLLTEFPREAKEVTRLRTATVPRSSFLGTTFTPKNKICVGVGFSTDLTLSSEAKVGNVKFWSGSASITFDIGGKGCEVSDKIGTLKMTLNPEGGWPLITEIKGEAGITAVVEAGSGPAKLKKTWVIAKAPIEIQFGTETIVSHHPVDTDFLLSGDLGMGEGLLIDVGPELVGGLALAADVDVGGDLTNTIAYTTVDPEGNAVLMIALRDEGEWEDPIQVPLAPEIGVSDTLTLGDGRTIVAYSVFVDGQDPHDPYVDNFVYSRIIEADGTVGNQTFVTYISNPIDQLALAESGSLVELHIKAPATDGTQHFWQTFLAPFNKTDDTWGTTQFRVNETENFDLYLTSGGANGADEILLHWVTQSGDWHWMRTTDTDRQTVSGSFAAPPATWANAGFYEHVAPTRDGRILRFGQVPFSGGPSERDLPLVEGAFATQVTISQQSVTPGGGYLVAWVEKTGHRHELAYLTYGPDGVPVLKRQLITNNSLGDYSDLILSQRNADAVFIFARFTQGGFSSLRSFELDLITGLTGNDDDGDNLMDIAELLIVDADLTDGIELVDHVLDGDDFDGDGATNGEEIRAGSDPANEFSLPPPPEILTGPADLTVAVTEPAQFSVDVAGENLTYQWRRNGLAIPAATSSTFTIASTQSADAGIYDVLVKLDGGIATSLGATLTVTGGDALPSAVIAAMGVTDLAYADLVHLPFQIDGDGPKRLLLRALGPAIGGSASTGNVIITDPYLILRDRLGAEIDANENWEDSPDSGAAAQIAATSVGAIPLMSGSSDAALVVELAPGNYTVESGGEGSGLIYVELFDLDESATPVSRLASLGFHSQVPIDGFMPSLGFVVSSPTDRDIVTRYLGPALGRADALLNPSLTLMSGGSPASLIGSNDDWESGNLPALLIDSIRGVRLESGSLDAARIDQLSPGNYLLNAGITTGDQGFGLLELIDPLAQETVGQIAALVPPIEQAVVAGSIADFNVLAIADSDLSYQWNFNDQPITGATDSTLVLSDVQPTAEGSYTVQLSTTGETVTTAPAALRVLGGGPVRANQSSNVETVQPGGTATITVELEWDETPINLAYQTTLPEGWILRGQSATAAISAPAADSTGALVWQFGTGPGASPLSFTFEIETPAELTGLVALTGAVSHEPTTGNTIASEALPHPLWIGVSPGFHDADTDGDRSINLSELLRVIELYNTRFGTTRTGRYQVQSGTTDGFSPDATTNEATPISRHHTGDFDRDGTISLSELLRVIELYNTRSGTTRTGAYRPSEGTTDGFTPDS